MQLTKNQQAIINLLLQSRDYVSADQVSKKLGFSTKTILRNVKSINAQSNEKNLIISERGKGLKLDYSSYILDRNNQDTDLSKDSIVERRNNVLLEILFRSPYFIDLDKTYDKYYVSKSVIETDIKAIKELLITYDVNLQREGYHVSVYGNERNIRQALNSTIIKLNLMNSDNIQELSTDFPGLDSNDEEFLVSRIEFIERQLNIAIPYPYNINLFSHMYIMMNRFKQGAVKNSTSKSLTEQQEKIKEKYQNIYRVTSQVIDDISNYLHIRVPLGEEFNLLQYLVSVHYNRDVIFNGQTPKIVEKIVSYSLDYFSIDKRTKAAVLLAEDLTNHIKPMMNRLNSGIVVANRLLSDIQVTYPNIFDKVRILFQKISRKFKIPDVPNDEIGFITLYFAKYKEQVIRRKKVLIMCTSGFGTAQLLNTKISKVFPELQIVDVIGTSELNSKLKDNPDIDMIISTVNVKKISKKIILVSALFNSQDRDRIERELEKQSNENTI
ncbi:Transcriptional antiterminator [Oenococcus oeni]|uniref:BglG family transcription antiterminator n=1 Tax=Oenococcus oeni TaxID=1247 RepID=UPI00107DAEF2|nr:PRD domain-containing protein [Oenococcus oeni]AVI93534.1 transcriptional antiterminator [Oenococcus oeni]SYV98365.1 Transcriptional antiterminator [Oenococcus oeni]SYW00892.1 Transcriptional antiterminator [Oenococcus oeni]SYW18569.1 Transcriptional antiterminator [Oenococcus oeni]VDC13942.1 Transcriptional antiterminator [Oenococcus oeni]